LLHWRAGAHKTGGNEVKQNKAIATQN